MNVGKRDWVSIKAEYVSGGGSFQKLADKFGLSVSAIKRRSVADGGWEKNRTKTEPKVYQKTVQKVIEKKSAQEADRITRLLDVGDKLVDKLQKATGELGTYTIIKRKQEHGVPGDDGETHWVEDTVEIAQKTDAVICTADLKRLASALKDIHTVIEPYQQSSNADIEDLTPLAKLLEADHEQDRYDPLGRVWREAQGIYPQRQSNAYGGRRRRYPER